MNRVNSLLALRRLVFVWFSLVLAITSLNAEELDIEPGAYYVATTGSDSNDGRLNEDGGTGPWRTIQHAAQLLEAGDTVYVREGIYTEPGPAPGYTSSVGIRPKNSGEDGKPIRYIAYPGEKVVLDQNVESGGFYLKWVSYIHIKDFEIRNGLTGIAVKGEGSYESHGNVFENNYIHHMYGEEGTNPAGIRLDFTTESLVRNNRIHDIYEGGDLSLDAHDNNACIHGYKYNKTIIENNELSNCSHGIYHKNPPLNSNEGLTIRRNLIYNTNKAIRWEDGYTGRDGIQGSHNNVNVYENIIYNSKGSINVTINRTWAKHINMNIYNNVFDNAGVGLAGMDNVKLWNNIILNDVDNMTKTYADSSIDTVFSTDHVPVEDYTPPATDDNGNYVKADGSYLDGDTTKVKNIGYIDYIDYNNYFPYAKFIMGVYGKPEGEEYFYLGLEAWQSATTSATLKMESPDSHATQVDPMFVDRANHNYRLKSNSPLKGAGVVLGSIDRVDVGAFPLGFGEIGLIGAVGKPNAPVLLVK